MKEDIISKIERLKKARNAVILIEHVRKKSFDHEGRSADIYGVSFIPRCNW